MTRSPSRTRQTQKGVAELVALLDSPFLRALADSSRLDVLRVLMLHGPSNVGGIAEHLPRDRSVISRHLQALEEAGVVRSEWRGRERLYAMDGARFVATLEEITARARVEVAHCCPPAESPIVPASSLRRPREG